MREIKFRGKRNNGKWAYGSLVYSPNIQPAIYFEMGVGAIKFFDWCYIDPASVGQYTGIKDKNGVEIYEGDIIRYTDNSNEDYPPYNKVCDVTFEEGCFYPVSEYWVKDVEVIGNIYDNPELLKTDSND